MCRFVFIVLLLMCLLQWPFRLSEAVDGLRFTRDEYLVTLKEDPKGATLACPKNSRMGIEVPRNWRWKLSYSIVAGNQQKLFRAEPKIVGNFVFLKIKTRPGGYINRESVDKFVLKVQAEAKRSKRYKEGAGLPVINATTTVTVVVLDGNDLSPLFGLNVYSIEVPETSPVHSSVFRAVATDADLGFNAEIFYGFSNAEAAKYFAIHPYTGVISLVKELKFRQNSKFELSVFARNRGFNKENVEKINYAKVRILVVEANRYSPEIHIKKLFLLSQQRPGSLCAILNIIDKDLDINGFVDRVDIVDETARKYFRIVPSSSGLTGEYALELLRSIDDSTLRKGFDLAIQAVDSGRPPRKNITKILFRISDRSHKGYLDPKVSHLEIPECIPVKTPFPLFDTNLPTESFLHVRFDVMNTSAYESYFSISKQTGVLYLEKELDYESMPSSFNLTVSVTEEPSSNTSTHHPLVYSVLTHSFDRVSYLTNVTIRIQDCNDNDPSFQRSSDEIMVEANVAVNETIYKVEANDADAGSNGLIVYSVMDDQDIPFSIDQFKGSVYLSRPIDLDLDRVLYKLIIKASDHGSPFKRESRFLLNVALKGMKCIAHVNRTKPDDTSALTFPPSGHNTRIPRILSGNDDGCFHIDEHSNALVSSCSFEERDYQNRIISIGNANGTFYEIVVAFGDNDEHVERKCQPLFGGNKTDGKGASGFQKENIMVGPLCKNNLRAPNFIVDQFFEFSIKEDTQVGSEISQIEAEDSDCDFNGLLRYSITSGNEYDHFKIDAWSGALMVLRKLDCEAVSRFVLNVTACDCGTPSRCSWKQFTVSILDMNDNAPEFLLHDKGDPVSYRVSVLESAPVGTKVLTVSAKDADSGTNGVVRYSILNTEFFDIDALNGVISLKRSLDRETTSEMNFFVVASDLGIESRQSSVARVVVTIEDVNDNIPYIRSSPIRIYEDIPVGSVVGAAYGVDPDLGASGFLSYYLRGGTDGKFNIDLETGVITLASELDYSKKRRYVVVVDVKDNGQPSLASSSDLIIEVLPCQTNQNAPLFKDVAIRSKVRENQPPGTVVVQVTASDADKSNYRSRPWDFDVSYVITGGSGVNKFSIDKQGVIKTSVPLDREKSDGYWLTVTAIDAGVPRLSSNVEVFVKVIDVNDNSPRTDDLFYKVEIPENSPKGTPVIHLKIRDDDFDDDDDYNDDTRVDDDDISSISMRSDDSDDDGVIRRSTNRRDVIVKIASGNPLGMFDVDNKTGVITTTSEKLDREQYNEHLLEVLIEDGLNSSLASKTFVMVVVTDINDNPPKFVFEQHLQRREINIPSSLDFLQNLRPSSRDGDDDGDDDQHPEFHSPIRWTSFPGLFRAVASDADFDLNGRLIYEMEPSNSAPVFETFRIDSETGIIFPRVNWIQPGERFDVKVRVSDHGNPRLSSVGAITMVSVSVPPAGRDRKGNNRPRFNEHVINSSYEVLESDHVGSVVFVAGATDRDGDHLWYFIADGNVGESFSMNIENGCVIVSSTLDYEINTHYDLSIIVTDGWHYDVTNVHIRVYDVNDNSPRLSIPSSHDPSLRLNISESHPPTSSSSSSSSSSSTVVGRIQGTDLDGDGRIHYSIVAARDDISLDTFKINHISGEITAVRELDRELLSEHLLLVSARDHGVPVRRDFVQVFIHLYDENDHAPRFHPSDRMEVKMFSLPRPGGQEVVKVLATDEDEAANGEVFYSIVSGDGRDNLFKIDPTSGLLSTTDETIRPRHQGGHSRSDFPMNFTLVVGAHDHGTPSMTSFATLKLTFEAPREGIVEFEQDSYEFEIPENQYPGRYVGTVRVSWNSGEVFYVLEESDNAPRLNDNGDDKADLGERHSRWFQIHPFTGVITASKEFDFELNPEFKLKVKALGRNDQSATTSVVVKVTDVNDNEPRPTTFHLSGEIEESAAMGDFVRDSEGRGLLRIGAVDSDGTAINSELVYRLASSERVPFEVSPRTGLVRVTAPLDREMRSSYSLKVQISDSGAPPLHSPTLVSLSLSILDVNDNRPEFIKSEYKVEIPFPLISSTEVVTVSAVDLDDSSTVTYSMEDDFTRGSSRSPFQVDPLTGVVSASPDLNRDLIGSWRFRIVASDGVFESKSVVEVHSRNSSSSSPDGCMCLSRASGKVVENLVEPQLVGFFEVVSDSHDSDRGRLKPHYELVNYRHLFSVHSTSGVVHTKSGVAFDREDKAHYTLVSKVTLRKRGFSTSNPATKSMTCRLDIVVADVNDNPPTFPEEASSHLIGRDRNFTGVLFKISAVDKDAGINGLVHYEIVGGDEFGHFQVYPLSGEVSLTPIGQAAFGNGSRYGDGSVVKLIVKASDNGQPQLSSTTMASVVFASSKTPLFEFFHYEFDVHNNVTRGHHVGLVRAGGNESSGQILFELVEDEHIGKKGRFSVGEKFGLAFTPGTPLAGCFCHIIVLNPLFTYGGDDDEDCMGSYHFIVRALDITTDLTAETRITINVLDVTRPLIRFLSASYESSIQSLVPVGSRILTGRALYLKSDDTQGSTLVRYRLMEEHSKCLTNSGTGILTKGAPNSHDFQGKNSSVDGYNDDMERECLPVIYDSDFLSIDEVTGEIKIKTPLHLIDSMLLRKQQQKPNRLQMQRPNCIRLKQCLMAYHLLHPETRSTFANVTVKVDLRMGMKAPLEFDEKRFDSVLECDAPSGTFVKDLSVASDANLTYSLKRIHNSTFYESDNFVDNILAIDLKTGIITVRSSAALKKFCSENLPLKSSGRPRNESSSMGLLLQKRMQLMYNASISNGLHVNFAEFQLHIRGANLHSPIFERNFYHAKINSNVSIGSVVVQLHAMDLDEDLYYGGLSFDIARISRGHTSDALNYDSDMLNWFSIHTQEAIIRNLKSPLEVGVYELEVRAKDGGGRTSQALVRMVVQDPSLQPESPFIAVDESLGDHREMIGSVPFRVPFYIDEFKEAIPVDAKVGSLVAQVLEDETRQLSITSQRRLFCGQYSILECLSDDICSEYFEVNASIGDITVKKPLKRIENRVISFKLSFNACSNSISYLSHVEIFVIPALIQPPYFEKLSYLFFVDEDKPVDWVVAQVRALHPETLIYAEVPHRGSSSSSLPLKFSRSGGQFSDAGNKRRRDASVPTSSLGLVIEPNQGVIKIAGGGLDRESTDTLEIFVRAQSTTNPFLVSKVAKVVIRVMDINDNSPQFDATSYTVTVSEGMPPGTSVFKALATDSDLGLNGEVIYFLTTPEEIEMAKNSSNELQQQLLLSGSLNVSKNPTRRFPFAIDERTGWMRTTEVLDREEKNWHYRFVVVAHDMGVKRRFSWVDVIIRLEDLNDNKPHFERDTSEIQLSEDLKVSSLPFFQLRAVDLDPDACLTYGIRSGNVGGTFDINGSGQMTLRRRLDREVMESYDLEVVVGDGKYTGIAHVLVNVLDVNDNSPTCALMMPISVSENLNTGSEVVRFSAFDADMPGSENSAIVYSLDDVNSQFFTIDSTTGVIYSRSNLNRKTQEMHAITAIATDRGGLSCRSDFHLFVLDVNDETPRFNESSYFTQVMENGPAPVIVGRVSAVDDDLGKNGLVRYSLTEVSHGADFFSVHPSYGLVTLLMPLDRESHDSYTLIITAHDMGTPSLTSTVEFTVEVLNVNDNPPTFDEPSYHLMIPELTPVGSSLARVTATRDDSAAEAHDGVTYSLLTDPMIGASECCYITIHPKTGDLLLAKELDFEAVKFLSLVVSARDDVSSLSSSVDVKVEVIDVNDHTPAFEDSLLLLEVSEDVSVGTVIWKAKAKDLDSGNNSLLHYSIADGSDIFYINGSTGEIHLRQQLDREKSDEFKFMVLAADQGIPSLTGSAQFVVSVVDVNDSPPRVINDELNVSLQEDVEIGHEIVSLAVVDDDLDPNAGPFTFDLISGNSQHEFFIDLHGTIRTASKLDSKIRDKYELSVRIYDNGFPPQSADITIGISVLPQINAALRLHPLDISIWITEQDESFVGGVIGKVKVTGSKLRVMYFMQDGGRRFSIDPNDGTVKALDELKIGSYNVSISASDGRHTSQSHVHISVSAITTDLLKNSAIMSLKVPDGESPDLFTLMDSIAMVIGVTWKEVKLIGVMETLEPPDAFPPPGTLSRTIAKRDADTRHFDVLMAVKKSPIDGYFKNSVLKRRLEPYRGDIESRSKVRIVQILTNPCTRNACPKDRECHPKIMLDPERSTIFVANVVSIVSIPFKITNRCSCKEGMSGPECNKVQSTNFPPSTPHPTRTNCFGDGCQENNHVMTFSGKSFVSWQLTVAMEKRLNLRLWLRTRQRKARIMQAVGRVDYSLLEIDNGRVQYKFDCGGGPGMARVDSVSISDGQWHAISVERIDRCDFVTTRNVRVVVDHVYSGEGRVPGVNDILNLDSDVVYFGGEVVLPDEEVRQGFVGCLKDVSIDSVPLSIRSSTSIGVLRKVQDVEMNCIEEYFVKGQCSGQCLNGGTCIALMDGSFECRCQARFTGSRCQISVRPCLSNPCLNGGTCADFVNGYNCTCLANYGGKRCESGFDCGCMNGGHCVLKDVPGGGTPHCECPGGFYGVLCENDVDECLNNPCPPSSSCINSFGSFTCNCSNGVLGKSCKSDANGYLPTWKITSEEVFIITATLASLLLISLFLVLACKCCCGSKDKRGTSDRKKETHRSRDPLEARPLRPKESRVFFYSPKPAYDMGRSLDVMKLSHQAFPYGASSTSASSGSFNYSTTGDFKTFQDPGSSPINQRQLHCHRDHHHHHLPPPIPQRPTSYLPLNNRRYHPVPVRAKAKEMELEKEKAVEPKMAVIGELENLLAKGCIDRNVSVLKSTAAAIQNRLADSRLDAKRNDLAMLSRGKITKSPDCKRPTEFYCLSFDNQNDGVRHDAKRGHQNPPLLAKDNKFNAFYNSESPNRRVQTRESKPSEFGPRHEGVQTKFIHNNYAGTSPEKQLKFQGNFLQTQNLEGGEDTVEEKNFNNVRHSNDLRPFNVEELYSVPNKPRLNRTKEAEQKAPSLEQQMPLHSNQGQDLASKQQHGQQIKLLQQAQQLPQHVRQHLSMFPQKNLPVIHSKAIKKHESIERQSSRVKLEQLSSGLKKEKSKQKEIEMHQNLSDIHPEVPLPSVPPEVPPKPLKNINCLKEMNQQTSQQLKAEDGDDCSWKGDESEYVGDSETDDDEDEEDGNAEEKAQERLFVPSWIPDDYSIKMDNIQMNKEIIKIQKKNLSTEVMAVDDEDDDDITTSVNDSSIDGILSNAVGNESYNSFDDNTINKFLRDTLQLFKRKRTRGSVGSSIGRTPSERGAIGGERGGQRVVGKTSSFRSTFGDRGTSREASIESDGKVKRKLSFGSRNFEAKNWLREKLFGKVNSYSEVESVKNVNQSGNGNNRSSGESNLFLTGKFNSNEFSLSSVRSSSSLEDPIPEIESNDCLNYRSSGNYDNCFSDVGENPSPDCLEIVETKPLCTGTSLEFSTEVLDNTVEEIAAGFNFDVGLDYGKGLGCGEQNLAQTAELKPRSLALVEDSENKRNAVIFDSDDSVNFINIDDGNDDEPK